MSAQHCQVCDAVTGTGFICYRCVDELDDMLAGLTRREIPSDPPRFAPGWIALLEDATISNTRLGDTVRHSGKRIDRLDGDAELAACIGLLPEDEDDLERARKRRHQAAQNKALAAGRVNERANHQLRKLTETLDGWVTRLGMADLPAPYAAWWLRQQVNEIAARPDAGQCHKQIHRHIVAIEHIINRPPPTRFCGPCPTMRADNEHQPLQPCRTELRAEHDAVTVICPTCHTGHEVEELQDQLWQRLENRLVTYPELVEICRRTAEPVPVRSTLYKWIDQGRLTVKGYQRPDGHKRIGVAKHSDIDRPVYRLGDVRRLMAEKPRRKAKT